MYLKIIRYLLISNYLFSFSNQHTLIERHYKGDNDVSIYHSKDYCEKEVKEAYGLVFVVSVVQLSDLLRYENTRVLSRYQKDFPQARLTPRVALREFLKYVWLVHQHQSDKRLMNDNPSLAFECVIHEEMKAIDDMWHTFLLFTRDYQHFCEQYLNGKFFHHQPADDDIAPPSDEVYITTLENYLNYIKKHLGEETLHCWFEVS